MAAYRARHKKKDHRPAVVLGGAVAVMTLQAGPALAAAPGDSSRPGVSPANPDGGGHDAVDHDNGCGNETEPKAVRDDDNNGNCGGGQKQTKARTAPRSDSTKASTPRRTRTSATVQAGARGKARGTSSTGAQGGAGAGGAAAAAGASVSASASVQAGLRGTALAATRGGKRLDVDLVVGTGAGTGAPTGTAGGGTVASGSPVPFTGGSGQVSVLDASFALPALTGGTPVYDALLAERSGTAATLGGGAGEVGGLSLPMTGSSALGALALAGTSLLAAGGAALRAARRLA